MGKARLLFTLAAALLVTSGCGGDGDGGQSPTPTLSPRGAPISSTPRTGLPLSVQAWANHACSVAQQLQDKVDSLGDEADRESLPLEQRKERIAGLSPQIVAAAEKAAQDLAAVAAPLSARALHDALHENLLTIAAAQAEAQRRYAAATSVEQLEATNEALINTVERAGERVQLSVQRASPNVIDALTSIESCGGLVFEP